MGAYINPAEGELRITSKFGMRWHPVDKKMSFHNGIDIAIPKGTPVLTIAMGVITEIRRDADNPYGLMVEVKHLYGYRSFYAHLSKIYVAVGMAVVQGDCIGLSGNTGTKTTGAHLHLGMSLMGVPVNPLNYIPA